MLPWARVIGGVLKVCGFRGFLANAAIRKSVDDPIREVLQSSAQPTRVASCGPRDWAKNVVMLGLTKSLLPVNERETAKGRERSTGVVLKRHLHETFTAYTETKRLRLRLEGGLKRWKTLKESPMSATCSRFWKSRTVLLMTRFCLWESRPSSTKATIRSLNRF